MGVKNEWKRVFENKLIIISFLLFIVIIMSNFVFLPFDLVNIEYENAFSIDGTIISEIGEAPISEGELIFLEQKSEVESFKEKLSERIENNDNLIESKTFEEYKNKYISENQRLRKLENIQVSLVKSYAESKMLQSSLPRLLGVLMVPILIYVLFYEDIQVNTINIYNCTRNNLKYLYKNKMCVAIQIILFYSLMVALMMFAFTISQGIGGDTPIQMINSMNNNLASINITEFIFLQCVGLFISTVLIFVILLLLILILRNIQLAFVITAIIMLFEYIMADFIPINSRFLALKVINIYYAIVNGFNFTIFMSVFSFTISTVTVMLSIFTLLSIALTIINYRLYLSTTTKRKFSLNIRKGLKTSNLFSQQLFSLMISKRGLLMILLIFMYSFNQYNSFKVIELPEFQAKELLKQEYYGVINEDDLRQVDTLIQEKKAFADERNMLIEKAELTNEEFERLREINIEANSYSYLLDIYNEMSMIIENGGNEYLDQRGYELLFSSNSPLSLIQNYLLIYFGVVTIVATLITDFKKSNILQLQLSMKNGKLELKRVNLAILLLCGLIINAIVGILFVLKISKFYQLFEFNMKMNSIFSTQSPISFYVYSCISIGILILSTCSTILISYSISLKKNFMITMAFMLFIFMSQLLLYFVDIRYSLFLLLNPNVLNYPIISIVYIVFLIIISLLSNQSINKHLNIT